MHKEYLNHKLLTLTKKSPANLKRKAVILAFLFFWDNKDFQDYLFLNKRNEFTYKLFNYTITVLEHWLPTSIKINNKLRKYNNLIDLDVFSGKEIITTFIKDNIINYNNNSLYYKTGNSLPEPYFFGKVINIKHNNYSIFNKIVKSNFHSIEIDYENCEIELEYYQLIPHYQISLLGYFSSLKKELNNL